MERVFSLLAGILGSLAVLFGAFGAHGLRGRLDPRMLEVWHTAAHYHLLHAAALLGVAWLSGRAPGALSNAAGYGFVLGIVLFSGSLYAMALTGHTALGRITPVGGLAFIVGWLCLALAAWRGLKVD